MPYGSMITFIDEHIVWSHERPQQGQVRRWYAQWCSTSPAARAAVAEKVLNTAVAADESRGKTAVAADESRGKTAVAADQEKPQSRQIVDGRLHSWQ